MWVIALPAVSRLKLIKSAIWKRRGHRRAHKSCPCPFHSSVSGKQARSHCELAMPLAWQKVTRKSRALSRSGIFGIVPVPSSILATAGHHRHDGHLGSLAPEPSLPCCYLSWREGPQPVSAVEIFKAALIFFIIIFYFISDVIGMHLCLAEVPMDLKRWLI